jgi:hypothetical protein
MKLETIWDTLYPRPATLKCPSCGVNVRLDHIGYPDRCHADCPLDMAHSRAVKAMPPHGHPIVDGE